MVNASFLKLSRSLPMVAATFVLSALGPPAAAASCDDPTFGAAASLGLAPVLIHVGEVNGDGKLDIISVEDGAIKVAFGNGNGTFLAPVVTAGPATPLASVVGSWNGDGLVDLAVAAGASVTFFLGDATLGFVPASGPYAVGATVKALAGADFNGDGQADALVTGATTDVYVLTGNGDGTFDLPALATALGAADVVRVGDLDGDLDPDLALLRRTTSDVLVALNDGTGTFPVTRAPVPFPTSAQDLLLDDFDRDGRLDLAVISKSPNKALYVRLGTGDAFFEPVPRQTSLATNNPEFMVAGNFNGDAFPDLSITQQGSIDFEILLGAPDGTFVTVFTQALGGGSPTGETTSDLNGDGLDDFIVAFEGEDRIAFNTTGDSCASFVTATSTGGPTSGQNLLQWRGATSPADGVRIRYTFSTAPPAAGGCVPPTAAATGVNPPIDLPYVGGRQEHLHGGLTPGTYYCYSVFVLRGSTWSEPRSLVARPFDGTGLVKWGFSTGTAALAPPGNGIEVVHVAANDAVVYAIKKGAGGGTWPDGLPEWSPRRLPGPSQGRPSTVGVPVGSATQVLFLGAQDGHVYALDAQTGDQVWRSPHLASMVQAAPSGMFVGLGGNHDYILVGTRNTGVPNAFYALRLADGTQAWAFDGGGRTIGPVNSQATVDYVSRRVYFTSLAHGPTAPDDHTVWCVDLDTGARRWSVPVGDVVGSPILRAARAGEPAGRVYVGSWNTGTSTGLVHALDADTGAAVWGAPFPTGADGPVKAYVAADRQSATGRLFFSTTNRLWALDDPPGSTVAPAGPAWVRDFLAEPLATRIETPSTPAYLAGGGFVFVGSGDGSVYRLDYATGDPGSQVRIPLGDPAAAAAVGSPTLDLQASPRFLYAGTVEGVVYAVQLP
ncbi:MAG TPA: FG-GAP-like repeat-containing protein [Vicinamibacteria bacterium]